MENFLKLILDNLPSIITGLCGLVAGIAVYFTKKTKYKTAVCELETQKIELEKTIAAGSYVLCPKCGEKIFLTKSTIYVGGNAENVEKKCE